MTTNRNYGRAAFWAVVALLTVITATSAVRLKQWAREPYVTLPAPVKFSPRIEEYPCGNGIPFVYPARVQVAYRLSR